MDIDDMRIVETEMSDEAYGALLMVDFISTAELTKKETLVINQIIQDLVYVKKINLFGDFFAVDKEKIAQILDVRIDFINRTLMKMVKAQTLHQTGDNEYFFMPF